MKQIVGINILIWGLTVVYSLDLV